MNNKLSPIETDSIYGAHNYAPLPIVIVKGKNEFLWDDKGNRYIDLMSAYSAVSLGHSNKKITKTVIKQVKTLSVTSRAMYNDKLPAFLEAMSHYTGMAKTLPMNSGAEAVETALKLARKWGYKIKKIPENQALIVACENNFHGRTLGVISMSTEAQYKEQFGPLLPGIEIVPYNDVKALEKLFKAKGKNIAAFLVEPIQGEAGIVVPTKGYLKKVRELCSRHQILMIIDEIQTGLMRTGKLFNYMYEEITPDLVIMGKALGGGVLPISAVSGSSEVLGVFSPGDHGSTFGGNPLACSVALSAMEQLTTPELEKRVVKLGNASMTYLNKYLKDNKLVKDIRGQGLFIGIEFKPSIKAKDVVSQLIQKGIISKDTHEQTIRIAPPLTIRKKNLFKALKIIVEEINALGKTQ